MLISFGCLVMGRGEWICCGSSGLGVLLCDCVRHAHGVHRNGHGVNAEK